MVSSQNHESGCPRERPAYYQNKGLSATYHARSEETETRVNAVEASMRDSVQTAARNRLSIAIRQLRAAYGLSYEEIQAQTGLSQQLLWDLEYKDHRLTLAELNKLAACFDMTASDLLGVDLE